MASGARTARGFIDYSLDKRATLMALFRGVVDACDADPYLMRAAKWHGEKVTRNCPVCKKNRVGTRNDLFGMFDILYLTGSTLVGLQVTSGANHAARVKKIMAEPRAAGWLRTGALIEVWSWQQKGPRGKRKKWECRKEEITLEALP